MTRTLGLPVIPANSLIANFESFPAQPKVHDFSSTFPVAVGRRKIAFLGDSITAQGFGGNTATGNTFASVGYAAWVAFLSRRRVEISPESNFGVSGETTAQMLARIDAVAGAYISLMSAISTGTQSYVGDINLGFYCQNLYVQDIT